MADSRQLVVTQQRLLEAAGEVFADAGYRAATVRDICKRAGANVAAVKYHFGGKDELYAAAVHYAHECARLNPENMGVAVAGKVTPEERLHAFIRAFFLGVLAEGKPAWHGKLMAREMAEPTGVLDKIVDDGIRPRYQMLSAIVAELLGPAVRTKPAAGTKPDRKMSDAVVLCANSVVGQILFYHFAGAILTRLHKDRKFDSSAIKELAEHVARFCVGGIREVARHATTGATQLALNRKGAR